MKPELQLRPRYTFSFETEGRDGDMYESVHLWAELKPEHVIIIAKEGLTKFVDRFQLSVLPYREVLKEVLKEHDASDIEELSDREVFATESEFVDEVYGVYGSFFNDVVYGSDGLIPPTGGDEYPDLRGGYWPTGRKFKDFSLLVREDGPPILQCIVRTDRRGCVKCGEWFDLFSQEKEMVGGHDDICPDCTSLPPIPIGCKVSHKKFGLGEILSWQQETALVQFGDKKRRIKADFLTSRAGLNNV